MTANQIVTLDLSPIIQGLIATMIIAMVIGMLGKGILWGKEG